MFAIAAITLLLVLGAGAAGVGATAVDPYGDELMRLTNADRGALGKPALTIDPTLASFARDLSWTCPTNGALVVRGRAADMADRGYFSHSVAGCLAADGTDMSVLDVMSDVLGYRVMRGENIAWNNYGTETASYAYGCAIDGTGCTGTTSTPKTVEVAERGFMQSSGHRANILNTYDRFGCGSALAADGHRYYACVFSLGGPAPTPTPDPTPTTAPTPTPDPITTPTPSPVPALAPAPKPTPVRDIHVPAVVSATGAGTIRVGSSRRVTAIVTDNLALARLELRVDGRLTKAWSLRGTRAWRATVIASWRLRVGHHLVRWTVRDRAGHVRSRSIWIVVRR